MITLKKQSRLSRLSDVLMIPVMYLLQGTVRESPQVTHYWNNVKFPATTFRHLDSEAMVSVSADVKAVPRWLLLLPIFHMPILGGWKRFVVIEPVVPQDCWYVGWVPGDTAGVSQIKLTGGPVRLLQGGSHVFFFGINEHGEQIQIRQIGEGVVGKAGVFSKVPLL